MSKLIGGIYELKEQIGAGGGSIVYIGWHINLRKTVVLKADKRSLKASEETLRREVDMLKNLSNTYIPQVYDFLEEDGVVYTVMEYIEGKSLEDLIERGDKFYQSDVIRWACQALSALDYLHKQPPYGILHGDIKPANIMLRDNGDICLIDYNIALALGEDGAVQVGYSRGYASPEHYGISYLENSDTETFEIGNTLIADSETILANDEETAKDSKIQNKKRNRIKLDARSDIYSLGATLYHLISGKRPEIDAPKVSKLDDTVCSPALASIISKAMHPVIGKRYQSADEMLQAFLDIYKNDKRSIRFRREKKIVFGALSIVALAGIISVAIGMKRQNILQQRLISVEYSKNALQEGDKKKAISLALSTLPDGNGIFDIGAGAKGQEALTDALGIYNLASLFEDDNRIELPGKPLKIVSSEYDSLVAYIYNGGAIIYNPSTKEEVTRFSLAVDAKANVCFLDNKKILYAGSEGICLYDIESKKNIWTKDIVSEIVASKDGNIVVGIKDKEIFVYNVNTGEKINEISLDINRNLPVNDIFADNKSDIFDLNTDGSLLALSFEDGSVRIYPLNSANPKEDEIILTDASDYRIFTGGFCDDNFGFTASKDGKSIVAVIDTKKMEQVVAYESDKQVRIKVCKEQFMICDGQIIESLDMNTKEEKQILYLPDSNIEDFDIGDGWTSVLVENKLKIYSKSGKLIYEIDADKPFSDIKVSGQYMSVVNRDDNFVRVIKNDNNSDKIYMTYDDGYSHDEAGISDDKKRLILFSINGMRIMDSTGAVLSDIEFPDKENIYDQQYRKAEKTTDIFNKDISGNIKSHVLSDDVEGSNQSWLEVTWYDGTVRKYDDTDGHIISENKDYVAAKDLYEEFHTKDYKVVSELHKPPYIYNVKDGKLIKVLDSEDYLTYVTQIDDKLLLEYVRASVDTEPAQIQEKNNISGMTGVERYGILLDNKLEIIANLPGLCDHSSDTMYFDDGIGVVRQTKLTDLSKLKDIARKSLGD